MHEPRLSDRSGSGDPIPPRVVEAPTYTTGFGDLSADNLVERRIAHMGIFASRVEFSFSTWWAFDVAGAGFRRAESAVELMETLFSGGSGVSRGEARRRRRAWRALDTPEPPEVSRT
jgi:hypothetical protein